MSIQSLMENAEIRSAVCSEDAPLFDAAIKIADLDVNALAAVNESGKLTGIITDHDIIRALVSSDDRLHRFKVADHMTPAPVTCDVTSKLSEAVQVMGKHRIRHLVVMDGDQLAGVVGIKDILAKVHEHDTLEANVLRDMALASQAASV